MPANPHFLLMIYAFLINNLSSAIFYIKQMITYFVIFFGIIESQAWKEIPQKRKMQYMLRLLDKLEMVSVDERRNTARSILYLCQGSYPETYASLVHMIFAALQFVISFCNLNFQCI